MKNQLIVASLLGVVLVGCSVSLKSYPEKINPVLDGIRQENFKDVAENYNDSRVEADSVLFDMELGRVNQIKGDLDGSIKYYASAIDAVKDEEEKALVSTSSVVAEGASVVVNDTMVPYKGASFEHVMLHTEQALNYLFKGDISNATPEIRLADDRQAELLKKNEKKVDDAQSSEYAAEANTIINKDFANLSEAAGNVKSQFENGYAFYVAGLIYELNGEPDAAYLSYKNALELNMKNVYAQKTLVRLAKTLGESSDLTSYRKKFPAATSAVEKAIDAGKQEVTVLIEDGLVSQKVAGNSSFQNKAFALATYLPVEQQPDSYSVLGEKSVVVANINNLAAASLKEGLAWRVIKQVAKIVGELALEKNSTQFGGALALVGGAATSNADLRGWYTLPATTQVVTTWVTPGEQSLVIKNDTDGKEVAVNLNVQQGKKSVVRVIKVGNSIYTQSGTF